MKEVFFLLYVADQTRSARYYREVLDLEPIVDVTGITEFRLRDGCVVAVMPLASARKLLGEAVFGSTSKVPKAEVYLVVDEPERYHRRALERGGIELSPMQKRNWGHRAAYSMDPDGHVLAFAEKEA